MNTIVTVVLAYLLGCVNGGYYLVRLRTGEDLRDLGSGTLGARNTGRALGRAGFAVAMVWDVLKGVGAVGLATLLAPAAAPVAAVAVVLGHLLPIQLGLRGGKGLATSLGAVAALAPVAAVAALGLAAILLTVTRRGPPRRR
jgi:glycerol-3-phosphate acyltransferase PlsY